MEPLGRDSDLREIGADLAHHPGVLGDLLYQTVPLGGNLGHLGLSFRTGTLLAATCSEQGEGEPRTRRGETASREHCPPLPGLPALISAPAWRAPRAVGQAAD